MINKDYTDIVLKLKFYKEQIIKEFMEQQVFPNNELINNKLKNIDMHLSIFKENDVIPGHNFDVKEFNESIKIIYNDLKILYELLYIIKVKKFNDLQQFISSYLNELNSVVDKYKKKTDFENSSTTLGKTLLFQNNSFTITNNNSTTIINLEDIQAIPATTIACIANINNIKPDNLIFQITDIETEKVYNVGAYNNDGSTLLLPGNKKISQTEITIPEEQKINGSLLLDINQDISSNNEYVILGGKGKLFINNKNNDNTYEIKDVPIGTTAYSFDEGTYINFYVLNGNSIKFNFNKKPLAANFPLEKQEINNLDKLQHFFIECSKDFVFSIEIDKGEIYAIKENGIINSNKLYYAGSDIIRDFNVITYQYNEPKTFKTAIKIYNDNSNNYDVESIIIKQLEGV